MKTTLVVFLALYAVIATFHMITLHLERRKQKYEELHPVVDRMNQHGHKVHIVSAVAVVFTHPTVLEASKELAMHLATALVHTH